MSSVPPVSSRQPTRTQSNRLQQVASWVQQQQQQLRSSDPTVGAPWQQQLRNFRRNHHKVQSSLVDEESSESEQIVPSRLFVEGSDTLKVTVVGGDPTGLITVNESSSGESSRQRLTPDKRRTSLPKRTTQIALHRSDSNSVRRRRGTFDSVSTSISLWVNATQALIVSPAVADVVHCSMDLGCQVASLILHTASLPVTIPLQLCANTIHLVQYTTCRAIQLATGTPANHSAYIRQKEQSSGEGSQENGESLGIVQGILSVPGAVIGIAGSVVLSLVAPVLLGSRKNVPSKELSSSGSNGTPSTKSSSDDRYLDRLRLDYTDRSVGCDEFSNKVAANVSSDEQFLAPEVETSSFLLRVNDVNVRSPENDAMIFYVDLSPLSDSYDHSPLVDNALDHLVSGAIQLLSNHPLCTIDAGNETTSSSAIDWHPEGSTQRILRQRSEDTSSQLRDVLLWSGRFQERSGYGRHYGFFLARGNVPMPPREFAQLLWDNDRTSEYNHFCLGRVTLHSVGLIAEEDILSGAADKATKVIRSVMRVPIAGLTVAAVCLMHIRPLTDGTGYIMVSRTLDTGPSGILYNELEGEYKNHGGKHEILWGCNIIRSVAGQPNVTELTSLSQVGSTVPSFVAHKIGIMGVADFFKNVRVVAAGKNQ